MIEDLEGLKFENCPQKKLFYEMDGEFSFKIY